ncbi:uncharacterized protein [Amphiura filiformis]|uniref:uncharacterized protein n=1 Tax=Amphiura filiformis TaxID=82378 RepID=UPI003B213220
MNLPPPAHAPPSPPATPRSPPGVSYAVDRRMSSFDEGDAMDERMMMRSIWLKLGLLDTINYKIDATLKKLSVLESRMDRLEMSVKDGGGGGGGGGGFASGGMTAGPSVMENNHVTDNNNEPEIPMDTKDQPKVLPKPAKRQDKNRQLVPQRAAPSKAPTPFAQAGGVPTPLSQIPPPPPQHGINHHQPAVMTVDNVIPRSCMLNITNKEECERKLRLHQHNGMYLIRKSERANGKVLMVWFNDDNICKHYKIFGDQISTFQLDETPSFSSLVDLLQYYRDHKLPQSNVLLTIPFTG